MTVIKITGVLLDVLTARSVCGKNDKIGMALCPELPANSSSFFVSSFVNK